MTRRKKQKPQRHRRSGSPSNKSIQAQTSNLSTPEQRGLVSRHLSISSRFSGPIPPPELLSQYNDIIPDGANRIMTMAEKQQNHRMDLEKCVIEGDTKRSTVGLYLGFVMAIVISFFGYNIVKMGKDIFGFAVILSPLAAFIGNFIYVQGRRKKDLSNKSKSEIEKNE